MARGDSGGTHWGIINFDHSGRKAVYTNGLGRSPGVLAVVTDFDPTGNGPGIYGRWSQEDGQSGELLIYIESDEPKEMEVVWGVGFTS